MAPATNYLEILKLLPQTNCRQCGLPTCMAFAAGVMQGKKTMAECPHLPDEVAEQTPAQPARPNQMEEGMRRVVDELREKVRGVDFNSAPDRLGARLTADGLVVQMLGKDFLVDRDGGVSSRCHTNLWLRVPLLNYVINCQGREPGGRWVPLRDLPGGMDWGHFFEHQCQKPLKKIIDAHTDLFEIMIEVFGARPAKAFDSDIAVELLPLPKLPLIVCYWKPEDGMGSDLSLFWDASAAYNLNIDSLYYLGTGMANMFEKVARTHGS